MILKFSKKIIQKEWNKLSLTFFSVFIISFVISSSYLIIDSSKNFLILKNKEFMGGDVVFESRQEIKLDNILNTEGQVNSKQITFSAVVENKGEGSKTVPVNFKVVDSYFPLYGEVKLQQGTYQEPLPNEIYVDQKVATDLGLLVGDSVLFNQKELVVKGVVEVDPENITGGFAFLGGVIVSSSAVDYLGLNLDLFRKEYKTKIKLSQELSKSQVDNVKLKARENNLRAKFDDVESGGLGFGIDLVSKFLTVALIIISILTLVNIYASVNYLTHRLRRSFAILISIGMNVASIYKILFTINFVIVVTSAALGIFASELAAYEILNLVRSRLGFDIPFVTNYINILVIFAIIIVTSMAAIFPVLNRMRKISPKELLKNNENISVFKNKFDFFIDVLVAIVPILLLSIYLLSSFVQGVMVVFIVLASYILIAFMYHYFLRLLSKYRQKFPFFVKIIFAQKSFDGFIGLVTFASLFVALTSVYTLSILRTSMQDYLEGDVGNNLPAVYVLDVQEKQKEVLETEFNKLVLYPNVRARIQSIDGLNIGEELEKRSTNVDRELGREFNLTFRNELLQSEKVVEGSFDGTETGYVSVEKDFAKRANISVGSKIIFKIQGYPVEAVVTSLREVDSRSGYPFFYFILSPSDISKFPKTYFGYANYKDQDYQKFSGYLGKEFPNVTVINTDSIKKIVEQVVDALLIIILIVTMPAILLSVLLIIIILVSVAKERKRDGVRLMALGKTSGYVRNYYIAESVSTTVFASTFAYLFSILVTNFLIIKYIKIDSVILFDIVSFYIILSIVLGISVLSTFLWRSGTISLRSYLNYEENN